MEKVQQETATSTLDTMTPTTLLTYLQKQSHQKPNPPQENNTCAQVDSNSKEEPGERNPRNTKHSHSHMS